MAQKRGIFTGVLVFFLLVSLVCISFAADAQKKANGASCGVTDGPDASCVGGWCDNKICVPDSSYCGNSATKTWSKSLTLGSWVCTNGFWAAQPAKKTANGERCSFSDNADPSCVGGWCDYYTCVPDSSYCGDSVHKYWGKGIDLGTWVCHDGIWSAKKKANGQKCDYTYQADSSCVGGWCNYYTCVPDKTYCGNYLTKSWGKAMTVGNWVCTNGVWAPQKKANGAKCDFGDKVDSSCVGGWCDNQVCVPDATYCGDPTGTHTNGVKYTKKLAYADWACTNGVWAQTAQKKANGAYCFQNDAQDPTCVGGWCDNGVCVPDSTYCGNQETKTWAKTMVSGTWSCTNGVWAQTAQKKANGAKCDFADKVDSSCVGGWCDNMVCVPDSTYCGDKANMKWSKSLIVGTWACTNGVWAAQTAQKKANGAKCDFADKVDSSCVGGWCDNMVCVPDSTYCGDKANMKWSKSLIVGTWACTNGVWAAQTAQKKANGQSCNSGYAADSSCVGGWCNNKVCVPGSTYCGKPGLDGALGTWSSVATSGEWICTNGIWREMNAAEKLVQKTDVRDLLT